MPFAKVSTGVNSHAQGSRVLTVLLLLQLHVFVQRWQPLTIFTSTWLLVLLQSHVLQLRPPH
jgi:hypothetical protein